MTTATFVDAVGVDSIDARADKARPVPVGRLIKAVFLAFPLALGYLVGRLRRGARLGWAAFATGMDRGMAPPRPAANSDRE